jgi:plasmid stabilization system protein ParE
MAFDYKIFWTSEAINNLESILSYLKNSWTQRETENFKNRLSKQLILIQQNPYLFPISQYNSRLRKAVLSKQITVFYEVSGQIIYLIYLFNNKQNIENIK